MQMIDFESVLSPEECIQRIREHCDPPWKLIGWRRVVGYAKNNHFSIRKRSLLSSAFQSKLRGEIVMGGEKSILKCTFSPDKTIKYTLNFWRYSIYIIGTAMILITLFNEKRSPIPNEEVFLKFFIPAILIIIAILSSKIGKIIALAEKDFLINFLEETILAKKK